MKKPLITLALLSALNTASAVDFGVGYSRDVTNDLNGVSVSVTDSWQKFSLSASAERYDVAVGEQNQLSLVAGYQLLQVAGLTVEGQFGASYITSDTAKDGLTSVVGLGASMPLYKNISVAADLRRNVGGGSMKVHNGTSVGVGLKYNF
jgi:hypothetical protein